MSEPTTAAGDALLTDLIQDHEGPSYYVIGRVRRGILAIEAEARALASIPAEPEQADEVGRLDDRVDPALRLLWFASGVIDGATIGIDQSATAENRTEFAKAIRLLVDIRHFFGMNENGDPASEMTPEQVERCARAGFAEYARLAPARDDTSGIPRHARSPLPLYALRSRGLDESAARPVRDARSRLPSRLRAAGPAKRGGAPMTRSWIDVDAELVIVLRVPRR